MGSHRAVTSPLMVSEFEAPYPEEARVQSAGLSATRHYHPGVCHTCLASPPDPQQQPLTLPLMRCSQCQLLVYCSKRCQKKDWPNHRSLCLVNKVESGKNVFSRAKEAVAEGGESWDSYRTGLILAATVNLRRRLKQHEQEVFQYPRVCEVCKDATQEALACCPRCFSVFYCSSDHRDQDEGRHQRYCSHYLLLLECDRVEAKNGIQDLPFPVEVDEVFRNLPDKLMTLVRPQLQSNAAAMPLNPKIVTMITERLSYPLSLLYALQNIGIGADNMALHEVSELRVHVVGAMSFTELLGIIRWEYMVHRLPALRKLHITFIGPQLLSGGCSEGDSPNGELVPDDHILDDSGLTMCDDCHGKQRRIIYEMANMCYHEFVSSSHYTVPDVIVSFNCGFHEHNNDTTSSADESGDSSAVETLRSKDTWKPTLPLLVQHASVPLVFTSYTSEEAALDLSTLRDAASIKVLMQPHLNPYHSLRPYRNHEAVATQPIHFWNQYITCVRAES